MLANRMLMSTKKGYDIYTKVMLHMNGVDGSTIFTDEIIGKTWTAYGNTQIDIAQYKFGGASGLFDGTGDYIETADSEDFNVGSGNFTIDFWLKRNVLDSTQYICAQCNSSFSYQSIVIGFLNDNRIFIRISPEGFSNYEAISIGSINNSNWHHLAFVRNGNSMKIYIDGINDGTGDVTGISVYDSSFKFAIGRPGEFNGAYFNGWIDEFRFSKGIARWTSNFTPPAGEY